jgi:hypothetical protein
VLAATALVPLLTFGLDTAGGFRAALEMRLVVMPFSMKIYVFAQSFFFKLTGGVCIRKKWGERRGGFPVQGGQPLSVPAVGCDEWVLMWAASGLVSREAA